MTLPRKALRKKERTPTKFLIRMRIEGFMWGFSHPMEKELRG